MINNISLLIHGPYSGNILPIISENIQRSKIKITKIIFVIYTIDKDKYLHDIEKYFKNFNTKIIYVKDLINPGPFNINRQILSVRKGLELCNDDEFIIKLRNDQSINFNNLIKIIKKYNMFLNLEEHKILTTCSFSRKDRFYHPSDMFLCGFANELKDYYNLELQKDTAFSIELKIIELNEKSNYKLKFSPISAECILFKNYLIKKGYNIQNTYEDSYNSIKKFCYIVNTWNINLIWSKKRTNMFKENSIILPHYFVTAPFPGAPIEKHECWLEHEIFDKKPTIKDRYYIFLSKFVWYMWEGNINGVNSKFNSIKNKNIFNKICNFIFSMRSLENKIILTLFGF
ncbi:WavE lipopolysaccharide synthesis family protein, partial [Brachyspira intermedia]|uniref:WavE lipopolysaccharide synthesis family protein n=1 Tax=Brachyspira intermedia TaxID=84377 RepID=UPI0030044203